MAVPYLYAPYFVSDALYINFVSFCCGLGTWCGRLFTHQDVQWRAQLCK